MPMRRMLLDANEANAYSVNLNDRMAYFSFFPLPSDLPKMAPEDNYDNVTLSGYPTIRGECMIDITVINYLWCVCVETMNP